MYTTRTLNFAPTSFESLYVLVDSPCGGCEGGGVTASTTERLAPTLFFTIDVAVHHQQKEKSNYFAVGLNWFFLFICCDMTGHPTKFRYRRHLNHYGSSSIQFFVTGLQWTQSMKTNSTSMFLWKIRDTVRAILFNIDTTRMPILSREFSTQFCSWPCCCDKV